MNPLDIKRPLMLTLYSADEKDPEISEREALELGGVSADAVLVVRALFNGPQLHIQTTSVDGRTLKALSPSAIFHMWVSLTGHLARQDLPADNETEALQIVFLRQILGTMKLSPELGPIAQGLSGAPDEGEEVTPSEPSSPAEPPSPEGADPASTG